MQIASTSSGRGRSCNPHVRAGQLWVLGTGSPRSGRTRARFGASASGDFADARVRLMKSKADVAELRPAELRASLVPRDQVISTSSAMLWMIERRFSVVPAEAAIGLGMATTAAERQTILRDHIYHALRLPRGGVSPQPRPWRRGLNKASRRRADGLKTRSPMQAAWARFGQLFYGLASQGDLRRATELLVAAIEAMPAEYQKVEAIQKAIATMRQRHTRWISRRP